MKNSAETLNKMKPLRQGYCKNFAPLINLFIAYIDEENFSNEIIANRELFVKNEKRNK